MFKHLKQNLIYLFLIIISLLSSIGAIVYYIYKLNNLGIIISIVFSFVIFFIIAFLHYKNFQKEEVKNKYIEKSKINPAYRRAGNKKSKIDFLLLTFYFLLFVVMCCALCVMRTNSSIISPWQVVPSYFFALYILSTIILIAQILNNSRFSLFLISVHLFLSTSIAWIIYKIGYGFDPFIHEATINLIMKTGEVLPKTYYYIGQYSLIAIINKITHLPILWLNKLLLPVLASVFLPYSIYKFLNKYFDNKRNILLTIITLFTIPYSLFILTTPQNLSYLFLIITVFFGLACADFLDLSLVYLFSATSLLIHPVAGIPAVLFTSLIAIYNISPSPYEGEGRGEVLKKYLYGFIYFLSVIALPIAFYFINQKENPISENIPTAIAGSEGLSKTLINLALTIPAKENFILNFVYLYIFNIKLVITFLALAGIFLIIKYKNKCKIFLLNVYMSAAVLISYFLVKKISFGFLIDYERDAYAERILVIAAIFMLPIITLALYNIITRVLSQKKIIKYIFLIFLSLLITTSLYTAYPRFDRYFNSRGYSVGQADIDAVNWIENNHENNYMVLANQQVSVAALREFGFDKYLKIPSPDQEKNLGEIYYYPIPTGGPLYGYYLKMVYEKPTKKTMISAMEFSGVDEAYFILNKYWWAFPKLLEEAKLEADSWKEINHGNIYIFKYTK